jgi:hypothetical protein
MNRRIRRAWAGYLATPTVGAYVRWVYATSEWATRSGDEARIFAALLEGWK